MSASTTRQIGGVLLKPDASPFQNSSVTIYRDKREVTPTAGAVIVDEVLRTITGSSGEVSMSLVPGKYLGQIRLSDVDRYFSFTVPDGAGPFVAVANRSGVGRRSGSGTRKRARATGRA